jgi:4-amino-4-deoxy-L-arabinose transferase-like glycosyltransferase
MTSFLVVLLLSTYSLGRELFDENVGLLSALLVSSFPIVMDFSRQFMLDMPIAAMTVLSLYLLVRTKEFNSVGWSLLLGIGLGCGALTKWTFPFFLIYPFLFSGTTIFLRGLEKDRRLRNLALCILVACAVSLPWYSAYFFSFLASRRQALVQGDRSIVETFLYYANALPQQTSWLLLFALVVGIALYIRLYRLKHLIPVLSIVGGYILLTMVNLKMPRFSIPLLPPLAVLACGGIIGWAMHGARANARRIWYVLAFSFIVIVQYLTITYLPGDSPVGKMLSVSFLSVPIIEVHGPEERNWQQAAILRTVSDDTSVRNTVRKSLRVIPDHMLFNWQSFDFIATLNRLPVVVFDIGGFPQKSDFVVLKTGELGEDTTKRRKITNVVLSDTQGYEFLRHFPLPDGSNAILMRAR